jgi:hypothetical protein
VAPDGTPKYALADGFCPSEMRLKEEAAALDREAAAGPDDELEAPDAVGVVVEEEGSEKEEEAGTDEAE